MVGVPLWRAASSYEQQPESHDGCDNTQDQEPDGPVTRCTGEKFQIPPDLVVKSQPTDSIDIIL